MPPKPGPDEKPEELDKLDTKPALDIESDVMAPINLECSIDGCTFKTGDLERTVAATELNIHSKAHHVGCGKPSGRRDRLQKLDRPVLTTGWSQQDFEFFKDEWRRYSDAAETTDDNLLQDQILQ